MSVARRSFAALSGLFLLQLMLLGSGTLCAVHHGLTRASAHVSGSRHAMAGMTHQMTSHERVMSSAGDSDTPMNPMDCSGSGDHQGCQLPFAPGQCSTMTACDVSAAPATMIASAAVVRTIALVVPSAALGHSGPTFAPELPPPRA